MRSEVRVARSRARTFHSASSRGGQIDELDRFKVVILANVLRMDPDETQAFREYVRRGGRIYASRYTSLIETNGTLHDDFVLADVFGASYQAEEQGVFVYLKPSADWVAQAIAPQKFVSFRTTNDPIRPPTPLCGVPVYAPSRRHRR